jgi:hypothetical protein
MTIDQLTAQLFWLLDQLAAVHESYSSSGKEGAYLDPDSKPISQGDYVWRLGDRIASTRAAIACRQEIIGVIAPPKKTPLPAAVAEVATPHV